METTRAIDLSLLCPHSTSASLTGERDDKIMINRGRCDRFKEK